MGKAGALEGNGWCGDEGGGVCGGGVGGLLLLLLLFWLEEEEEEEEKGKENSLLGAMVGVVAVWSKIGPWLAIKNSECFDRMTWGPAIRRLDSCAALHSDDTAVQSCFVYGVYKLVYRWGGSTGREGGML